MADEFLIRFLNTASGSPEHTRVMEIITLMKGLEGIVARIPFEKYSEEIAFAPVTRYPRANEMRNSLNEALQRYTYTPSMGRPFRKSDGIARLDVGLDSIQATRFATYRNGTAIEEDEAVKLLIDFTSEGLLSRLRMCHGTSNAAGERRLCGKWFVAARSDRKYCSDKCKLSVYAGKPEAMARHRQASKRQHRAKRDPKVKAVQKARVEWLSKSRQFRNSNNEIAWVVMKANQILVCHKRFVEPITRKFLTWMDKLDETEVRD